MFSTLDIFRKLVQSRVFQVSSLDKAGESIDPLLSNYTRPKDGNAVEKSNNGKSKQGVMYSTHK
jgi:hypothetical protein